MNHRTHYSTLELRADTKDDEPVMEGYFVRFNEPTELGSGIYEQISDSAFKNFSKDLDVRCLFNHNSEIVLGRTKSNTLDLQVDNKGLYGKVKVNLNDSQAKDIYERVKRGDINGASFGFSINKESWEDTEKGTLFTIEDLDIYEVSICAFPAYETTDIQARQDQLKNKVDKLKIKLREKLKNVKNTETKKAN